MVRGRGRRQDARAAGRRLGVRVVGCRWGRGRRVDARAGADEPGRGGAGGGEGAHGQGGDTGVLERAREGVYPPGPGWKHRAVAPAHVRAADQPAHLGSLWTRPPRGRPRRRRRRARGPLRRHVRPRPARADGKRPGGHPRRGPGAQAPAAGMAPHVVGRAGGDRLPQKGHGARGGLGRAQPPADAGPGRADGEPAAGGRVGRGRAGGPAEPARGRGGAAGRDRTGAQGAAAQEGAHGEARGLGGRAEAAGRVCRARGADRAAGKEQPARAAGRRQAVGQAGAAPREQGGAGGEDRAGEGKAGGGGARAQATRGAQRELRAAHRAAARAVRDPAAAERRVRGHSEAGEGLQRDDPRRDEEAGPAAADADAAECRDTGDLNVARFARVSQSTFVSGTPWPDLGFLVHPVGPKMESWGNDHSYSREEKVPSLYM